MEQIKADELSDQNLWRSVLFSLPVWRRKGKKHAAKRKESKSIPASDKKRKVDEESPEKSFPGRRVRLLSDSDESECSRSVVCVSDEEILDCLELGSGFTLSVPELDSIVVVWINPGKDQEPEGCN